MTAAASAVRPRILAELSGRPGQTAYEVAAALGYRKPDSRRIAEIVQRLWFGGALVSGTVYRPALGREARIYYLAPPGTRPRLTVETPGRAERRRASNRASKARTRARAAGKAVRPGTDRRLRVLRPAAASLGPDSRQAACQDVDPDLFFGPGREWPKARAARVAEARAYCLACPIRLACLEVARANRETYGGWGGVDFETERDQRAAQATRPDVAASSRA